MLFLQFRTRHVVIDTHVNLIQTGLANAVVCIYFRGYVNLRFKHAVEGTHRSCLRCLGQQVSHLLFVRKKSEKKRKKRKKNCYGLEPVPRCEPIAQSRPVKC